MHNPDSHELAAIHAQRDHQYSTDWFLDLLNGRLGPGETYWMGWLGVMLVVIPSALLAYLLIGGVSMTAATLFAAIVLLGLAVYRFALLRALWISLNRQPRIGGWGWAGLILTAFDATEMLVLAGLLVYLA